MIRCRPHHLEARATERGYTLDEVAACINERHDNGEITVDPDHPAYPRKGLGDAVGAVLNAFGITAERVSRVLGRKCKCKQRKAALNKIGQQTAAAIKRLTGGADHAATETSEQVGRVENRDA